MPDGGRPPLAEGALGLAPSPLQEAHLAEAEQPWQYIAGLLPAVQAGGTAVFQLHGHACRALWGLGGAGMLSCSITGAAAVGVMLEIGGRPQL